MVVLALASGQVESGESIGCPLCDALDSALQTAQQCQGTTDDQLLAEQLDRELTDVNNLLKSQPNSAIRDALNSVGYSTDNFVKVILTCNNPPAKGLTEQIQAYINFITEAGKGLGIIKPDSSDGRETFRMIM